MLKYEGTKYKEMMKNYVNEHRDYKGDVMETEQHKRRVRYSGTHPRSYKEKYKEHQPEKYADTISKVIAKGSTPAGMHISIMVKEILDFLNIQPGQTGLDATLGYGGHTKEMLKCLNGQGHIYALDVDPIESAKTRERLEKSGFSSDILTVKLMNFRDVDQLVQETGKFDFILADLGVSSMQIDNPDRGFSYKAAGPLDLRMNPQKGISAAERLKGIEFEELAGMLIENADEPYAEEIYEFLEKLPHVLNSGGRAAILTFHSGEDRLVKKSFKEFYKVGEYEAICKDVIRPSAEECVKNGRARSTKMRWAIKA